MKSFISKGKKKNALPFPKLMEHNVSGIVYLCTDNKNAVVVYSTAKNALGASLELIDTSILSDFDGSISLVNDAIDGINNPVNK